MILKWRHPTENICDSCRRLKKITHKLVLTVFNFGGSSPQKVEAALCQECFDELMRTEEV